VLFGSTNFSFRGIYIQANNALAFRSPEAAALFEQVFDDAFKTLKAFSADSISKQWHLLQGTGKPPVHFCFSTHSGYEKAVTQKFFGKNDNG
jgi:phosphatidylserine/phosphatidylglycerophosphate/cardiolipin synthase-like enzyme